MTWVYRTYDGGTNRNEQAKVISAEKVLLADPGRNYITPILLFTSAYLSSECGIKGGLRSVTNWGEPLRHHGSAFEVCIVPANQATNLDAFRWYTKSASGSQTWCAFPFIWVKHPELYGGTRPLRDVTGAAARLPEREFTNYLQGALDWFNQSRPLKAIDQMIEQTGDADTQLNGLLLLKRHPDQEMVINRLEGLVMSTNSFIVGHVVMWLAALKSERSLIALGKAVDNKLVHRRLLAFALGMSGHAAAVKHLEKLFAQDHPQMPRSEQTKIRLEIVTAATKIPTTEAQDFLAKLAGNKDPLVSSAAKQALDVKPHK